MAGSRNRTRARNARKKGKCDTGEEEINSGVDAKSTLTQDQGSIDCSSPEALKQAGNDALNGGDVKQAARLYTIGIDLILGDASPSNASEWFQTDQQCGGTLHALLSNRSLAQLKSDDIQVKSRCNYLIDPVSLIRSIHPAPFQCFSLTVVDSLSHSRCLCRSQYLCLSHNAQLLSD